MFIFKYLVSFIYDETVKMIHSIMNSRILITFLLLLMNDKRSYVMMNDQGLFEVCMNKNILR